MNSLVRPCVIGIVVFGALRAAQRHLLILLPRCAGSLSRRPRNDFGIPSGALKQASLWEF